jgi:hypothetical protein
MPLDGLTSGIDTKLTFTDANGVEQFALLESFNSKEDAPIETQIQIDGQVRHPKFHQGWSGSFMLQRNSAFQDTFFALQEAAYYQGLDQIPATITQTIQENDGSVSQWQYTQVVMSFDDAGTYSGTDIVKQRVSFNAARRLQLVA